MKKFNLIERLLSYSHEKQLPQRFGRYAAMLLMLLTLGVGQMWGIGFNKGNVIFRAQGWDNPAYVYLCIGKSDYTSTYQMSRIGDSDLYHVWVNVDNNDNNWWNGCTYFAVIGSSSAVSSGSWGSSSLSSKGNKGYTTAFTGSYDINNSSGCYFFNKANSTVNGGSFGTPSYQSSYTNIQKYNAIQHAKKRDSGTSYSNVSGTFPAPIKLKGEYLTSNSSSNRTTITRSASGDAASYTTYSAVVTGTITHSIDAENLSSDYYLEGWGTGSTPSVTTATYEYKITANTTVYAFFSHLYTLAFLPKGTYGTSTVTASVTGYTDVSSGDKIPTGHNITVTATPATGYEIEGWYSDADCTVSLNNGTNTTYTISSLNANKGVYVKFQKKTYSIILDDNGSYQGNGSATVQRGDGALTVSSHASRTGWNLVGYWTASGDGGSQVTDAAGNLIANVSGFTDGSGNWIKDANVSLYAHWNQINSLSVVAGSNISAVTGATSPVTLNSKYAISATPVSGYSFSGWTADPAANGTFDNASSASTNVTVKNGSVTVTGAATENMTTVTINANPAGAGTFTVDASAFTEGNTTTAGVATSHTVVATPSSGKVFHNWSVGGNATGTSTTTTYNLKGNGNAGTGTLTANFGIASGWYMIGDDFGGWGTSPYPTSDQLTYPYRGMSGVYYIPVASLPANKYWRVRTNSTQYNTSSSTTSDNTISKGTIYSLSTNTKKASKPSSALSDVWIVVNTGTSKKLWVQDPQTFHNVNVTNEGSGSKGTYKVTLKTTSAFTKGDNVFETTQYASGETFTVTVTGVTGYIPTITIGDNTPVTWWKEQGTYTADGTMSAADVTVTISYTPTRAVRFAKTTGCETLTATGPSSTSVSDNTKIKDGTEITFHQENSTGYTFSKWYSNNTGTSGTEYSDDDDDYTLTVSSSAYTIYPLYTEDMHTVTLNSSVSGGHVEIGGETVTSTSAGIATASPTITAVADSGYYFTGWTGDIGSGVTLASGTTSSASITIRATADSKSITANFARRWVLAGDWLKDGENWDVTTNVMNVGKISNTTFVSKQITGLAANTEYKFKLYDNTSGDHWVGYATSGQVYAYPNEHDSIVVNTYGASGHDITLKTAAQGDYYFYYNLKNHKLNISIPASRQVTMGTRTISDGTTSAYTGGTISAVDNSSNVITNGLYIASGANITFTASPKAGYIWRGWYDNEYTYGDPVATERVHTDNSVTDIAFTRYGLFEEALYTVTVHRSDVIETTVKVGVDTKPAITASTAPTGKVFDRWVTTGSATVADPYSSTTTITGASDNVSTVTATFKELPKIYIDLTSATGWNPSNMYVVFYKSGGYFDGTNGTGLSSTYVINALPLEMTKMGTSKIWYYAYDPTSGDFEGQTITCVTFIDHTYEANYGNFTSATAVYRTDFSSCMNMFVVTDDSGTNKNTTCYYRNTNAISDDAAKGYWRKYEEKNSGFYLNNLPGGSVEFTNEDGGNTYTAVANLDANTTYYFYLGGCNGWNWSNKDDAFNSNNRTRELVPYGDVSSDGLRCHLTTTAAGYYTFTLTPLNTGRKVQVSVAFPVAANDYRAVYHEKETSPTISRPSNIIKNDQNSGTISLWLNKGTNYISFQKAAVAVGGAVSWSACGSQQTVSDVPEAGIYNMTLTRDGSNYTVSDIEAYTGSLFIRTDCAPGKWADYTENRLDENTFNFNPKDANSYDYYYCKWINDAGTNVRCVIANDINVAISDTLKTEAILGGGETLPEGAHVRFSYNSLTNTLKRSYLTGASTDVFLNIIPDNAAEVYKTDGTTDMYGSAAAKNKFSDLGNWVYELDVKVKPNATAAVKANYNSTSQALIAAETKLVGGTGSDLYSIRLVYDFRTNYLMSAWMPNDDDITTSISLNSDMMIVRRGQDDAKQLSFSGTGELTDVKRAYGVFEFNKSEMVNNMNSWSDGGTTYGLCMYYFSLPFDVNVSDIFGVGTMGDDWRIQFYNGTKRAAKGWFAGDGTTTFWEDVPADTVLHAYEGYCLMLNRSHFNNGSHAVWTNVTTNAYLYFPSVAPVSALADNDMEITVPSHECKIDRFFDQDKAKYYDEETKTWSKGARNHKYVDSHWNMMGTPLFETANATGVAGCTVKIGDADSTLTYIYVWVPSTNSLSARQVLNTDFTFKPMYAYMVQYSGKVTFTGASITPASIAARRTSENKQYTIDLLLTKEDQFAGRTYVELRENAVDSFMLNEDMYMMKGSKVGDIYTHADGYELAANVLSVNSHIVPVSIDAKAAGTYTISMPSNFSGTVTLVDKYANTRTNLAFEDYEIYLEKGTISDRFELEININKTPTAIDGVGADNSSLKDGNAHKFIMNDMLYILKDGVLYDARGNRVK